MKAISTLLRCVIVKLLFTIGLIYSLLANSTNSLLYGSYSGFGVAKRYSSSKGI